LHDWQSVADDVPAAGALAEAPASGRRLTQRATAASTSAPAKNNDSLNDLVCDLCSEELIRSTIEIQG
jgi:hypothetical protein